MRELHYFFWSGHDLVKLDQDRLGIFQRGGGSAQHLRERIHAVDRASQRLPGDIHIEGKNGSFYFPVTTSILVSVILSILLNVISRLLKK